VSYELTLSKVREIICIWKEEKKSLILYTYFELWPNQDVKGVPKLVL